MIPPRPERPTQNELRESWAITVSLLESAKQELTASQLGDYTEFLCHNELELALDELERAGDEGPRSAKFWQLLAAAADNMKLVKRAADLRKRFDVVGNKEQL